MNGPPDPPTALLLDLDGTLLDTCPLLFAAYRHTVREHLKRDAECNEWLCQFGLPLLDRMGALCGTQSDAEAMVATYRSFIYTHHDNLVRCFDGVDEALRTAHAAGVRLAAVTTKSRRLALRNLEFVGLLPLFSAVIAEDDSPRHKPHPEPVLLALERLGNGPAAALMVGDSPYDIASARAAGVRAAAVLWGPFPRAALEAEEPDLWLEHPSDLVALCCPAGPSKGNR